MMAVLTADTLTGRALRGVLDSPKATVALAVCLLLGLAAVLAPVIAPQNPYDLMLGLPTLIVIPPFRWPMRLLPRPR